MSRLRSVALVAGLVALARLAAPALAQEDPTAVKFRTLVELFEARDPARAEEAQKLNDELVGMGADALPVLRAGLASDSESSQYLALLLLHDVGIAAQPVMPEILAATRSPSPYVRGLAAQVATEIDPGEATLARLIELLGDDELDVVSSVSKALGSIGPDAAAAVPALVRAGQHPGWGFATWMEALEKIGARPDLAVPALARELEGSNPFIAAHALASFGPGARPAEGALLDAMAASLAENLEEQSAYVRAVQMRDGVIGALAAIHGVPEGENVLVTIERLQDRVEPGVRDRLASLAAALRDADLVNVVIEVQPLREE